MPRCCKSFVRHTLRLGVKLSAPTFVKLMQSGGRAKLLRHHPNYVKRNAAPLLPRSVIAQMSLPQWLLPKKLLKKEIVKGKLPPLQKRAKVAWNTKLEN